MSWLAGGLRLYPEIAIFLALGIGYELIDTAGSGVVERPANVAMLNAGLETYEVVHEQLPQDHI